MDLLAFLMALPGRLASAARRLAVQIGAWSRLLFGLHRRGIPRRKPPANSACVNAGAVEGEGPSITSPMRGSAYTLRLTRPERENIPLDATTDADTHALYWFVDDAFIGKTSPGTALYCTRPSPALSASAPSTITPAATVVH